MYSRLRLAIKYFQYLLSASNGRGHGIHSPFVFDFIVSILNDRKPYEAYRSAEERRHWLLGDHTMIEVNDLGAGSGITSSSRRSIASIARHAAKPPKYGQLLYRIVKYYHPATVLELGASLGITTSYFSLAAPHAGIVTLEGVPAIAARAKDHFSRWNHGNVRLVEGNFDDTLQPVLDQMTQLDFCFVDGNHRKEPTLRYFQQLLTKVHNDSILVFDDIHWSAEMEDAWQEIRRHPAVRCTIDLFFIGIVVFRREFREKQEFTIRY